MKIAIDGPSGSGKGTISKILSEIYHLDYIDTGIFYRALALKILKNNIDLNDFDAIIDAASNLDIKINELVYLDGVDVTKDIRSIEVTNIVSTISSIKEVRLSINDKIRNLASDNIIMDGRDITTIVLPDADYKFYLDASVDVRALRRLKQNEELGIISNYDEIKTNIEKRDYNDTHKSFGALVQTKDQVYIDTTNMSIDEVIKSIRKVIDD